MPNLSGIYTSPQQDDEYAAPAPRVSQGRRAAVVPYNTVRRSVGPRGSTYSETEYETPYSQDAGQRIGNATVDMHSPSIVKPVQMPLEKAMRMQNGGSLPRGPSGPGHNQAIYGPAGYGGGGANTQEFRPARDGGGAAQPMPYTRADTNGGGSATMMGGAAGGDDADELREGSLERHRVMEEHNNIWNRLKEMSKKDPAYAATRSAYDRITKRLYGGGDDANAGGQQHATGDAAAHPAQPGQSQGNAQPAVDPNLPYTNPMTGKAQKNRPISSEDSMKGLERAHKDPKVQGAIRDMYANTGADLAANPDQGTKPVPAEGPDRQRRNEDAIRRQNSAKRQGVLDSNAQTRAGNQQAQRRIAYRQDQFEHGDYDLSKQPPKNPNIHPADLPDGAINAAAGVGGQIQNDGTMLHPDGSRYAYIADHPHPNDPKKRGGWKRME